MQRIVLFDGACNFCDKAVQFIIHKDPAAHFYFASLQSDKGQQLKRQFRIAEDEDSIVLIEGHKAYTKSTAALRIAKKLTGLWPLLYICIFIPRPIRNLVYQYIAKNRYKWFGQKDDSCALPSPEIRKRFL